MFGFGWLVVLLFVWFGVCFVVFMVLWPFCRLSLLTVLLGVHLLENVFVVWLCWLFGFQLVSRRATFDVILGVFCDFV